MGLIAAVAVLVGVSAGGRHRVVPRFAAAIRAVPPRALAARVPGRVALPVSQASDVAVLGSTAWLLHWDTGKIAQVDLVTRRVTRVVQAGGVQDGPLSMAAGAGSLSVLDFATQQVLRIAPATGAVTSRIAVPAEATGLSYGDGYVWVICDLGGSPEEHISKISPVRDAIVQTAGIAGAGPFCQAVPARTECGPAVLAWRA